MRFKVLLTIVLATASISFEAGCAAASAWWTNILQNPGTITSLLQYVSSFIAGVQAIWNLILPFLPTSSQSQASSDFSNAVFTLEQSVAALEDALRAAATAQTPNPDLSQFVANVQGAVQAVMEIITKWQTSSALAGSSSKLAGNQITELQRQAAVIKNWK
jgi:hypothetical protein